MTSPSSQRPASTEELTADILLKASWIVAGVAAIALLVMLVGTRAFGA